MHRIKQGLERHKRLLRFLISGGLAAVVEYGVFFCLAAYVFEVKEGWLIILAQAISFLCGLAVSFCLNKYWAFDSTGKVGHEFVRYILLAFVNLAISMAALALLVDYAGVPFWLSKMATMVMIATWNYFIFQKLIFKK